jgi:hypothetical protein
MAITVTGSNGHSVSIDLSATQNMLIAKQLAAVISSSSAGLEKYQSIGTSTFSSPDTVSLMAGTTTALPSTSVQGSTGASLFIGGMGSSSVAGASVLAGLGNSTLEGGLGSKPFTLAQGVASLNGGLGKDVINFVTGKVAGTEVLVDFAKGATPAVKIDALTPGQAVGGTTITLSDATKITFQAAVLHTPTIH